MILIDAAGHLVSDHGVYELHEFAARLGLQRSWFQLSRSGRHPHYDVMSSRRRREAVSAGATLVGRKDLVRRMIHA